MFKTPAWARKEGQDPAGGLNAKGRASAKAEGHNLKPPAPHPKNTQDKARKKSYCARAEGMKSKLTSSETANDPDSRINKSLRKWNCADGGAVDPYDSVQQAAKGGPIWDKPRPKKLGKPEPLSSKEKASAKAAAKAAGRPYPNLIDNMRAARADGGPVDDRSHEFVQEQLKFGEPQVPQYVAENDFPARAARGIEAVDTAASRVNNLLADVAGQPAMRSPEGRTASEVVQSAMPVDPYQAVQQAARQWGEGDKLGAAETMAAGMPMQGAIRSYHGSPYQFERFDTGKIGTGVGAQAYGHGLYFSDNPSVARSYRHSTEPVTISGRPVYSLYKDIEDKAANVPIQNASSYYDKLSVLEHLMDKGDALAVRDAAEREMFSPSAYDWFRKSVEPTLRTPGGLYEVGINADPKKFIGLYDELSLSDPLRERIASLAERATRLDEGNPLFRKGHEAMRSVRRQNATGAQMTDALDELLGYQNNPLREFTGISSELRAPEAVSKYLQNEGYAGYTYPHGTDAPGPERLNRVVFDPKNVDILRRYANGGEVEGDVQFAPDDPYAKVQEAAKLPMMAQHEYAMRMPEPEVRYDTGPQPGEATLKAYDPTIKERIYQGIAGTEESPSPERAQFARGMSQMAEFAPVLGNVMAGQEAQRRGDTKGMLMAALPVPGMATEARMAEAAASPVQQAAREAYQRVLNAQGMYSHAAEAAYNLPQAKGSYEQMMAMLQKAGVKPEEMRWSGVEQFAGQPVTREQLVSHFEQGVPKIEETVLSDMGKPHQFGTPEEQEAALNRYYSAKDKFWKAEYGSTDYDKISNEFKEAESALKDIVPGWGRAEGKTAEPTKFSQYTIPGGQNYREVLLGLPERIDIAGSRKVEDFVRLMQEKHGERWLSKISPAEEKQYDDLIRLQGEAEKGLEYRSSHWDQPNVLGHLRLSDRTGPQGEKILHMEELQSDWGQAGRKKGFALGKGQLPEGYTVEEIPKRQYPGGPQTGVEYAVFDPTKTQVGLYAPTREEAINSAIGGQYGVPRAPYVESTKNWVDLGLKRALKEAAEKGYDKLVWTPGAEQAARYDLSKQIKNLHYIKTNNGYLLGPETHTGQEAPINLGQPIPENKIADYVGKEVAEKIINGGESGVLSGLDLSVGGEGMKSFYDSIIPSRLKELMKKIDPQAKVELGGHSVGSEKYQVVASDGTIVGDYPNTALANAVSDNWPGTTVRKDPGIKAHSIQITPKMREAILKGLPAYAKGGEVVNDTDPYDNIRDASKNFPRARRASH